MGLTLEQAQERLRRVDLAADITWQDQPGIVLRQNPAPGVPAGTRVAIVMGRPDITLKFDPDPAVVGHSVTGTAGLQPPIEGAWYIFDWRDDTTPDSQAAPTAQHIYKEAHAYDVLLTVRAGGMIMTKTARIDVRAPVEQLQYAVTLQTSTQKLAAGSVGHFVAHLNPNPPSGQNVEYCLIWKDGPNDSPQNDCKKSFSGELDWDHLFQRPGDYSVTVSASVNGGDKILSAPVDVQVLAIQPGHSATLSVAPSQAQTGTQFDFTATLHPSPEPGTQVEYCFSWEDRGKESCGTEPLAQHSYASAGTWWASVRILLDHKEVARSPKVEVNARVNPPNPLPIWLYIAAFLGILAAAYAVRRFKKRRRPAGPKVAFRTGGQRCEIIHPELVKTKLLLRVRWVRGSPKVTLNPSEHIVKK
jgi:PKD repeat protein